MEDNSELHPGSLLAQCKKAIEVIDKENDAYEELIRKLRTNIVENDTMSGETADSIKAYVAELIYVIEYAIKANEIDKSDHQVLLEKVNSVLADKVDVNEVLCGYEIHNNISIVENRIESYRAMSEALSKECAEAIIDSLYMIKQEEYEDQIADLERELEDLKYKEERFNTIDAETINLFSKSSEIRKMASLKLDNMWGLSNDAEGSLYIFGKLKTTFNIFNYGDVIPDSNDDSEESDEKVYEAVHDYLLNYFSEEQILFLYKNKVSLIKSFYAAYHWDEKNCEKVIDNMNRCCMELEEKYSFVMTSIKNKIGVSDNTAKKYLYYIGSGENLKSLWNTYTYSSLDYNILLDKILTKDISECINKSKTYEEIYLDDGIFYDYIAVPKPGDIVTDLSDEKYQNMKDKRMSIGPSWISFENTNELAGIGSYYSTVGLDYELTDEKLTIICPGEKCDGMDIYNNNNYLVDDKGRYLITVGPIVLNPDYDVYNEDFSFEDFKRFVGCEIDVVLQNDNNPSDIITLQCTYGGDIKAHTDGWGEGICMSGNRYENAVDAGEENAPPDGSYIEFFGLESPIDDRINYSVINIIVRQ